MGQVNKMKQEVEMENIIVRPQVDTAQVSLSRPAKVFGMQYSMYIGRVYLDDIYRILFKFPISIIPEGCLILKAVLKVYVQSPGLGKVNSIKTFALAEDWSINNVTWNNQPSFYENVAGETIKLTKTGFYNFNITQIVQKWYNIEIPNYGLVMTGEEWCNSTYKKITTILNCTLGPQVEITYALVSNNSHSPCCTKFIERLEDVDTDDLYRFSSVINMSLTKTISFHLENLGNYEVEVLLQLSADGINFLNDSPKSTKIPGKEMIYLIPYTFAKYGRIAVRNINMDVTSKIRIWYQAQE